nr:zinc finger, CCHC-type [Tanacetum cinerariifolium]
EPTTNAEVGQKKNNMAIAMLYQAIPENMVLQIASLTSAKKQTNEEDMSSRLLFIEADKKVKDKHHRCEHCGYGNSNHGDFGRGQGRGQESRKGQGDSGVQRDKSHIRCHKCHELGHYRNECLKSEKKEEANLTQYEDD